mmetsp:Transcript_43783/g.103468  ORF Transcript_43783/g.103468 Transcript_43783/m.103468 type:complete len:857 (-) Transcript_43783:94-2664(-)|eukprot:CAMPEP_0178436204 /NCGR_PEP_ID=MMETSP0689_2-20121128/34320_1 /TAXON_ID=160604 /ORGANISM="Amphidinium massartii, Strain CS-259" /LENGTH=856 /DNA_ID=CAMNT_0020058295 /DNA_START=41 /DNA_END=2611 /DNA_ORIENTATION=-
MSESNYRSGHQGNNPGRGDGGGNGNGQRTAVRGGGNRKGRRGDGGGGGPDRPQQDYRPDNRTNGGDRNGGGGGGGRDRHRPPRYQEYAPGPHAGHGGCHPPPPPPLPSHPQGCGAWQPGEISRQQADSRESGINQNLEELRRRDQSGHFTVTPQRAVQLIHLIQGVVEANQCSASQLTDIMYTMGKVYLGIRSPEVAQATVMIVQACGQKVKFRPEHMEPLDLSNVVMCVANMGGGGAGGVTGTKDDQLMSIVAAEVVKKILKFEPKELANTAWAFAKCGLWNDVLVRNISQQCVEKMREFQPVNLSTLAWAMAQWGAGSEDLFGKLSDVACSKMDQFQPANLAMISWAFSNVNLFDKQLSVKVSKRASSQLSKFKISELSHLIWAYANHKIDDADLFEAVSKDAAGKLSEAAPSELSNIAWAYAKVGIVPETLMHSIAEQAIDKISGFKAHEIAQLIWAFAVAGIASEKLMLVIGHEVAGDLTAYSAHQLSHIAWAFGAVSMRHQAFFDGLCEYALARIQDFKAHGLSNLIWAMAMVGHRNEELSSKAAEEIVRTSGELRPVGFSRCTWAWRKNLAHMPDLQKAFTTEALKKERDFGTKILVKFADARFPSATPEEMQKLLRVLEVRIEEVTSFLTGRWPNNNNGPRVDPRQMDVQEYSRSANSYGIPDFGITGTPIALKQLQIGNVSRLFMLKCLQSLQTLEEEETERKTQGGMDRAFMEYNLVVDGQPPVPVVGFLTQQPQRKDAARESLKTQWLHAVEQPTRPGTPEMLQPVHALLAELVNTIEKHVQMDDIVAQKDSGKVKGVVEILTTVPPSLSCIGVMWQFNVLFQNVTVKFTDHAVNSYTGEGGAAQL